MPDDGDVDVIVYSHEGMFGDAPRRLGQGDYGIRLAPEFWRKFYAALAMQAFVSRTDGSWLECAPFAYEVADAMIAHEKNTEADGDGNGKDIPGS